MKFKDLKKQILALDIDDDAEVLRGFDDFDNTLLQINQIRLVKALRISDYEFMEAETGDQPPQTYKTALLIT